MSPHPVEKAEKGSAGKTQEEFTGPELGAAEYGPKNRPDSPLMGSGPETALGRKKKKNRILPEKREAKKKREDKKKSQRTGFSARAPPAKKLPAERITKNQYKNRDRYLTPIPRGPSPPRTDWGP